MQLNMENTVVMSGKVGEVGKWLEVMSAVDRKMTVF